MPSPNHRNRASTASQNSATGAAIRRGELKISDPIPFDAGRLSGPPSAHFDMSALTPGTRPEGGLGSRKVSPAELHRPTRNTVAGQGDYSNATRASAGPSLVPSSLSNSQSKTSVSQRKNSGFRATLRRMFGSKRERNSLPERRDYHQSDPGNLTSVIEKQTDSRVTQNPTQRVGSVTRASALGSHIPNSDAANLPRTSSDRKRFKSPRRRRRNTLPSLILTDQEALILAGSKDDLSAKMWKRSEPTEAHLKRRSRSADALNGLVASYSQRESVPQDRASQIAYWRTSIIDNPMPTWQLSGSREQSQHRQGSGSDDLPKMEPIQTFDFGLTKADTEQGTLEERVNTLEIKVFDFEYAIAKLQGHDIPKPMLYPKPPKRRSIHELFPDNGTKSTLAYSSSDYQEPTSFLTSPDESPIPSTENDENFRPDRSSKATTIRPLTARRRSSRRSNAPSPSPGRISPDQFDALMAMLKQEQVARKQLEAQVAELQQQITALRTPVYAEIRPINYPTPSPESIGETPTANRILHRSPRFEYQQTPQEQSRFSMSEVDTDTQSEDGFQDVYETPQENKYRFETTKGSPLVGVI